MRLLIWGCGGHGKVVGDLVRACGHDLVGYVDSDVRRMGQVVEPGGGRLVLTEDELLVAVANRKLPAGSSAVAVAIGRNALRLECARRLGPFLAPPLVHPRAVVSPGARLGVGTVVLAGTVVNSAAFVGEAVILNTACVIEHDCIIEDGVHVSPGAVLAGGVTLGKCAWIGAGAVVIPGVHIGANAVVGAGGVVLRNVDDAVTVVGVPAKPLSGQTLGGVPSSMES